MKQELEPLVGMLQYAGQVVLPGRSFVHHLIDLLKGVQCRSCTHTVPIHFLIKTHRQNNRYTTSHHHVHLNQKIRADLLWWKGIALFPIGNKGGIRLRFLRQLGEWSMVLCKVVAAALATGYPMGHCFQGAAHSSHVSSSVGLRKEDKRVLCHCDEAVTHMLAGRAGAPTEMPHSTSWFRTLSLVMAAWGDTTWPA